MELVLQAKNIVKRFGGLIAVNDVDFEVLKNEIVGIIGPNGAGKTTLFNTVTGQGKQTSGQIFFHNKDITGLKPFDIMALGMCRTFQNIRLFSEMTVLENIMVGAHTCTEAGLIDVIFHTKRHKRAEKDALERAEEALALVGLNEYRYHYATSLPYGLQRKLEIARALVSKPELLMFDEPAAGMNEQETEDLMALIRQLQAMQYTILLIEHDMRLVMNICDRIYVLDHGTLISQGTPKVIKKDPLVIEAYLGKEL